MCYQPGMLLVRGLICYPISRYRIVYDGNSGNVTIDGLIQSGLTYEYNSELAVPTQNDSTKNSITINYSNDAGGGSSAVKPGYKYVGTIKGNTEKAKNAAALASALAGTIPGLGWGKACVIIMTGYNASELIPSAYYIYQLYEKGFMTKDWYQYTSTRFYEDSERTKPMGPWWTSEVQKINLPNS